MMTSLRAAAAAFLLSVAPASAASLFDRAETPILSGAVFYEIFVGDPTTDPFGTADVFGVVSDGGADFDLEVFGEFTPGSAGADPFATLDVFDAGFDLLIAGELAEVEVDLNGGRIAVLFDLSVAMGGFAGASQALAVFTSASFPGALTGMTDVEISAVAPMGVIPLPAAAPMLLAGLGALAVAARRRKA